MQTILCIAHFVQTEIDGEKINTFVIKQYGRRRAL